MGEAGLPGGEGAQRAVEHRRAPHGEAPGAAPSGARYSAFPSAVRRATTSGCHTTSCLPTTDPTLPMVVHVSAGASGQHPDAPDRVALMIYVATVHVASARWIDLQLAFLRRNIREPFKVYANLQDVPDGHADKFDRVVPILGDHPGKLNLLAGEIAAEARPDDLIVFLDGDAFPDRRPAAHRPARASNARPSWPCAGTRTSPTAAPPLVLRGARAATGSASTGTGRRGTRGRPPTAGPPPTWAATSSGLWSEPATNGRPLLRSNRVNLHPLWFGVYGGIVYHHGAGFRWAVGRVDLVNPPRLTTRRQARARPGSVPPAPEPGPGATLPRPDSRGR